MASPKSPTSCSAASSPDPDVLSAVQVLDSDEPLVRASPRKEASSVVQVLDSCEPLVLTPPEPPSCDASCATAASSPEVLSVVQVLDSTEPLVRATSRDEASSAVQVLNSDELLVPTSSLLDIPSAMCPVPGCSSAVDVPLATVVSGSSDRRYHLYSEEVHSQWNLKKIFTTFATSERCIEFAEQRGMIQKIKMCSYHHQPMMIRANVGQLGSFRCRKSNCRRKEESRAIGTWFENVHLPLPQVFELMYLFSHNATYETAQRETADPTKQTVLSHKTIADWFNYCRETIIVYELEHEEQRPLIGGPGKIIQIDESKFGKRKYNRGRQVEGHWVLGMVEDGCDDLRLELCPDNVRSAEIMVPLIKKHVREGSIIHTDFWKAYDCLSEHGFIHKKVNHSDTQNRFVAPDGTHTQRIESHWRVLKRAFHKDNYKENFADWLTEFSWRRRLAINHLDPFEELIKCILYVYKT